MQVLRHPSLKNTNIYQILIILADVLTRTYNFMMKRISRVFYIFTRKNKRCDVSLSTPHIRPSFSRGHQTLAIRNLKIYCF